MGKEEGERERIYEDILLLMSAPPLGSISLTFMLDHSISLSLSRSLSLIFSLPPSCTSFLFLPIIQSASPLLSMNLARSLLLPLQLQLSDAHVRRDVCTHPRFAHTHRHQACTICCLPECSV